MRSSRGGGGLRANRDRDSNDEFDQEVDRPLSSASFKAEGGGAESEEEERRFRQRRNASEDDGIAPAHRQRLTTAEEEEDDDEKIMMTEGMEKDDRPYASKKGPRRTPSAQRERRREDGDDGLPQHDSSVERTRYTAGKDMKGNECISRILFFKWTECR